jgi:hypothetical protein
MKPNYRKNQHFNNNNDGVDCAFCSPTRKLKNKTVMKMHLHRKHKSAQFIASLEESEPLRLCIVFVTDTEFMNMTHSI